MSGTRPLKPKDPFPEDLKALPDAELELLAVQLQEEVFRECNSRAGKATEETLRRQALVEVELSLRSAEPSVNPGPA